MRNCRLLICVTAVLPLLVSIITPAQSPQPADRPLPPLSSTGPSAGASAQSNGDPARPASIFDTLKPVTTTAEVSAHSEPLETSSPPPMKAGGEDVTPWQTSIFPNFGVRLIVR